jgi:hypothetical protein
MKKYLCVEIKPIENDEGITEYLLIINGMDEDVYETFGEAKKSAIDTMKSTPECSWDAIEEDDE